MLGNHDPEGGLKLEKNYKSWVRLVIRAVTIWQTIMQKNRVKALYQDWALLLFFWRENIIIIILVRTTHRFRR